MNINIGKIPLVLYKGQRPRAASMIAGVCFFEGLFIIKLVSFGNPLFGRVFAPFDPVEGAFFGAIYGYVIGLLISGVFLAIDKLRNIGGKSRGRGQTI